MENNNTDIENLSIVELKALWFDQYIVKTQTDQNLDIILQKIKEKSLQSANDVEE